MKLKYHWNMMNFIVRSVKERQNVMMNVNVNPVEKLWEISIWQRGMILTRFNLKSQLWGFEVSTVELPEGYSQSDMGAYETMIQGYKGEWLDFQMRDNTIQGALRSHMEALELVNRTYVSEVSSNG